MIQKSNSFENCVLCNQPTAYVYDIPVLKRHYYITGVGQLCSACFHRVYGKNAIYSDGYAEPANKVNVL